MWIAEVDDLSSRNFLTEVMKGFDDPKVVISYAESAIINSFGLMIVPNFRWSRDKEKTGHYKRSYINDGNKEIEEIKRLDFADLRKWAISKVQSVDFFVLCISYRQQIVTFCSFNIQ